MTNEIINAEITSTRLGYEDHGIFTLYLTLKMSGSGVSIGGYALDRWNGEKRVGIARSMDFLTEILHVVGVDTWEELSGQYIRIESNGLGRKVNKIGNLMENKWLDFEEFLKEDTTHGN